MFPYQVLSEYEKYFLSGESVPFFNKYIKKV
nr:MAG TPA: hypothetical protein [Bacteriophage sp.]